MSVYREQRVWERAKQYGFARMKKSLGTVTNVVCRPDGQAVCGLMVRRPDLAMMVKRRDMFVELDAIRLADEGRGRIFMAGCERTPQAVARSFGLDWNRCIFALGLTVCTENGVELGRVRDLIFDLVSGVVNAICIADGILGRACVGEIAIPTAQVVSYRTGAMIVRDDVAEKAPSGGFAAWAGARYAEAKTLGKETVKSFKSSARSETHDSSQSAHTSFTRENRSIAHTAGKKLAQTRGMFSAFKKEFRKNSK